MTIKDRKITEEVLDSENSSKKGLPKGWTRTTLAFREDQLEALKLVAWWKKTSVKSLIEKLARDYLASDEIRTLISKINTLEIDKD